ncbi:MAG: hypothetical protein HYT80_03470 [Euryarchaeota archaeon]|nr:hypothetical protein [Euryarchaeota archaeon]
MGLAPGAVAQAEPTIPSQNDAIMEVYFAGAALGGAMATTAPTGATAKKVTINTGGNDVVNPGASRGRTVLGSFTPAADATFTADAVANLWLVSTQSAAFDQIQANIYDGATAVASGITNLGGPVQIGTAAFNLRIGIDAIGKSLKGGKKYTVELVLFGVSAAGTPTEVFLLFDSEANPSGVIGAVDSAEAFASTSSAYPVFLAEKSLTLEAPTATADKRTNIPTSCTGACAALSGEVEWGAGVIDRDLTATGETVLTVFLGPSAPAGAVRGFNTFLTVGTAKYPGTGKGTFATTWSSATTVSKFTFGFPTRGAEFAAGAPVKFSLAVWSTTDTVGPVQFVYGSVGRPAGFVIPVAGGGGEAAPELSLGLASAALEAPAGDEATAELSLTNPGESDVNVTVNSTGDLDATEANVTVSVPANSTVSANVSFAVPADAAPGTRFNVTLFAWVGDGERDRYDGQRDGRQRDRVGEGRWRHSGLRDRRARRSPRRNRVNVEAPGPKSVGPRPTSSSRRRS